MLEPLPQSRRRTKVGPDAQAVSLSEARAKSPVGPNVGPLGGISFGGGEGWMRGRTLLVDEVVLWLEQQLKLGTFQVGQAFPSERVLSTRLRVSRGAIREAKSRLAGRGILSRDRWRTRFALRDGAAHF